MTERDTSGRRWQNETSAADDNVNVRKPEGKETLWSFKVVVCVLNDVMYG